MCTAEQKRIWHQNYYLRNKKYVKEYNELCGAVVQRSYRRVHRRITKKCLKARADVREEQNEGQDSNPSMLQDVIHSSPNEELQEKHENDPSTYAMKAHTAPLVQD